MTDYAPTSEADATSTAGRRPWFLRGPFWQSVLGQALGTVLGGYLAVTLALAAQGLTQFTGWKLVGQTALVIGVILFGIGVLMIFAVGLGAVTWPLRKRLADRPLLKLLFETAMILVPIGGTMLLVVWGGKWIIDQILAW
ncbi:hypothetical protein HF576_18225 [Microbacterium sp. CFH 90308]|uniref:Uncharacterized protein n=1 Tax=Microbacterium salsuginis TaxID=2722803 RepID=A0ABX1KGU1_9MICO|nr:hypothetical protein [Microbacterium sp. CFH 90308]NLP85775.1 hypothetical protein [Microbacterium sp. CFH 90308]